VVSGLRALRHSPHALQVQKRNAPEPGWTVFCFGPPCSSCRESGCAPSGVVHAQRDKRKVLQVSCYRVEFSWCQNAVTTGRDGISLFQRDQCEAHPLLQCTTFTHGHFSCTGVLGAKSPKRAHASDPCRWKNRHCSVGLDHFCRTSACLATLAAALGTYLRWSRSVAVSQHFFAFAI